MQLVPLRLVFKLGRYNTSAQIFKTAMARSAQPLSLLFYFMLIANIMFASAIYYAEDMGGEANPSDIDNFGLPVGGWIPPLFTTLFGCTVKPRLS